MTSIQYSACHNLWSAPTFRVGFYCRHPARVISWLSTPWRLSWVTVVPGLTLAYYCNTCWPFYLIRTDINGKLGNILVTLDNFEFFIFYCNATKLLKTSHTISFPSLTLSLQPFPLSSGTVLDNQVHVLTIVYFFQTDKENTRKYL